MDEIIVGASFCFITAIKIGRCGQRNKNSGNKSFYKYLIYIKKRWIK